MLPETAAAKSKRRTETTKPSVVNLTKLRTRSVEQVMNEIQTTADYSELGILLIVVTGLTLILPILFVFIINKSKYKTSE